MPLHIDSCTDLSRLVMVTVALSLITHCKGLQLSYMQMRKILDEVLRYYYSYACMYSCRSFPPISNYVDLPQCSGATVLVEVRQHLTLFMFHVLGRLSAVIVVDLNLDAVSGKIEG